jgi:hypothetical protein
METAPVQRRPLEPRTPVEIVATGLKLYASNLGLFLNTVAVIVIPAAVIGMLLQLATIPSETGVRDGALVFEDDAGFATFAATAGVTTLIMLFTAIFATAAIVKAVADQYLGRTPTISDSLSFARGRWGALLRMGILEMVIVVLGFIALIIPGIYLVVAFAVASPVLLLEGTGAREALKRSRELVKGRWLPVLGVLVLSALVGFVLSAIGALFTQPVLNGVETVRMWIFISSIGEMIAQILAAPLGAAITIVLYFDLRARKEGFGLHELQTATDEPGAPMLPPPGTTPEVR